MLSYFSFFLPLLRRSTFSLLQQPNLPAAFTCSTTGFLFASLRTSIMSSLISSSTTCDGKLLSIYSWIAFVFLCCPSRRIQGGYATHEDQSQWLWNIYFFLIRQSTVDTCKITSLLLLCLPALTRKVSAGSSSVPMQTSTQSCFLHIKSNSLFSPTQYDYTNQNLFSDTCCSTSFTTLLLTGRTDEKNILASMFLGFQGPSSAIESLTLFCSWDSADRAGAVFLTPEIMNFQASLSPESLFLFPKPKLWKK